MFSSIKSILPVAELEAINAQEIALDQEKNPSHSKDERYAQIAFSYLKIDQLEKVVQVTSKISDAKKMMSARRIIISELLKENKQYKAVFIARSCKDPDLMLLDIIRQDADDELTNYCIQAIQHVASMEEAYNFLIGKYLLEQNIAKVNFYQKKLDELKMQIVFTGVVVVVALVALAILSR